MRIFFLSIFCLALLSFGQKKSKKKVMQYPVSGIITGTSAYCGGARPPDELLAQLGTPTPRPGKKVYIKKGEVNSFNSKVVAELTTDTAGKFHVKLPPGKYLIVDEEKKDLSYYNKLFKEYKSQTESYEAVDTVCLKAWYLKPDFTFEVKNSEIKNISVNYRKECFNLPCTRFRGPYPP
jgi:hypothetical protein